MGSRGEWTSRRTTAMWLLGAAGGGLVLAYLNAHVVFVNSTLTLVTWAVAALAMGALIKRRTQAVATAALLGWVVVTFMWFFGYNGSDSYAVRLWVFPLLGVGGAVCAAVLAFGANLVSHSKFQWRRDRHY